jgi:hypothetical protein
MNTDIGKTGMLTMQYDRNQELHVNIRITNEKPAHKAFGKKRLLVTPITGRGEIWVLASSVTLD